MDDFRQKAKQSFKLGLDFVHKKAQQTLESTRLHSQLRQAQEQKQQALLTLGERVCVMFDMDRFQAEELKDGVEQVRQLQAEIQALVKERKGAVQAPKEVIAVASLPLTAVGKLDKKALRQRFWTGDRAVG